MLSDRLRVGLRVVAYAVLIAASAQSVGNLLLHPVPGIGGDLHLDTSEMRDLERELNGTN